ncbi:hypothetical protein Hanom_Chr07g00681241 [Helianthus anomalus]
MLEIQFTRLNLREFINKENLHMCKFAIYTCVNLLYLHMCKKSKKNDFEMRNELCDVINSCFDVVS